MAVTNIRSVNKDIAQSIEYIINPAKTDDGFLVASNLCVSEPHETAKQFEAVRQGIGGGKAAIKAKHLIQSFAPGEVTPEEAMLIAQELCLRLLKDEYQYALAVHNDHDHVHAHIIFNNVNMFTGNTFETEYNQGKKSERAWAKVRKISDDICRENKLSVIENAETSKGKSHYEWDMSRQDISWKAKLKFAIDQVVKESESFEDFLLKCKAHNIEVVYNPNHKIDLKFRIAGQQKFARAKTLGWYYEKTQIAKRIDMYKGVMSYTPKTKIIATDTEKIQGSLSLYKWADLKNKQELSKAINIASKYQVKDNQNLEEMLHIKFRTQGALSEKLNHIKNEIDELDIKIKVAKIVKKYKALSDESKSLSGRKKNKFDEEHAQELHTYSKAVKQLKEWYPDGNVPTPESLDKKRNTLLQECSDMNEKYSVLKSEIKDLNYARQTLDDYFRNERNRNKKKEQNIE